MQSGDYELVAQAGQRAASLPRSLDDEQLFLSDLLVGVGSLWLGGTAAKIPLVRDVVARADAFDQPRLLAGCLLQGVLQAGDLRPRRAAPARHSPAARDFGRCALAELTRQAGQLVWRMTRSAGLGSPRRRWCIPRHGVHVLTTTILIGDAAGIA
jgi:hypothetical protein